MGRDFAGFFCIVFFCIVFFVFKEYVHQNKPKCIEVILTVLTLLKNAPYFIVSLLDSVNSPLLALTQLLEYYFSGRVMTLRVIHAMITRLKGDQTTT